MKKFSQTILLLLPFILLVSCMDKQKTIKSTSPGGSIEIEINGKKTFVASPWELSIQLKKGNQSNILETEMYTDEPSQENILFNWSSETRCTITLIEQDGVKRSIPVILE